MDAAQRALDKPHLACLSRRQALCRMGIAGLSLASGSARLPVALAQDDQLASGDSLSGVALPPDVGQAELQVYVEATGHSLRGLFLDYWRANGAAAVYGDPISEPFAAPNGYYSQAFERGIFQYRPEFLYTADPIVRLMPLGELALQDRPAGFRPAGWWGMDSDARLVAAQRPLDPMDEAVARVLAAGGVFVEATGHTIGGEILAWYTFNEGAFYLGAPLTEPLADRGRTVQYFEGGLLQAGKDGVALAPLAAELAPRLGIDTTPIARGDLPPYDELLFWTVDTPNPLGDPYAPGPKWIEVSLAEQRLWAYQGDTTISSTLVSTGLEPNGTDLGLFHVRLKFAEQNMQGFTDATGEVLGLGEARPGTIPYAVEAVPHVVYFNMEAEALHGAYWHNNFGQQMSHGCINLPLDFAAWLYGWAPLGTGVWVHE